MLLGIHHIQLAMPKGGEAIARDFYGGVLELDEVPKPEVLKARGGVWFEAESLRLHLGVDPEFSPARKAHPGLATASLEQVLQRLKAHGVMYTCDVEIPGLKRAHIFDPFGNRLEIVEETDT